MPTPERQYRPAGLVMILFPATVLVAMRLNHAPLPMPWPILFGIFFLYGLRTVSTALGLLDLDSAASWLVDAACCAGLAAIAFHVCFRPGDGFTGGIPFLPDSWNYTLGRVAFALGGTLCSLLALRLCLKAYHQSRHRRDDNVRHT